MKPKKNVYFSTTTCDASVSRIHLSILADNNNAFYDPDLQNHTDII